MRHMWSHPASVPRAWPGPTGQAIVIAMERDKETEQAGTPSVQPAAPKRPATQVEEIGGRKGPDPTRYGDWEVNGRCVDF